MICLVSRRLPQHFGLVCKSIGTFLLVQCVTFSRCCVRVDVVGSSLHFSECRSIDGNWSSHFFLSVFMFIIPCVFLFLSSAEVVTVLFMSHLVFLIKYSIISTNLYHHLKLCLIIYNLCYCSCNVRVNLGWSEDVLIVSLLLIHLVHHNHPQLSAKPNTVD